MSSFFPTFTLGVFGLSSSSAVSGGARIKIHIERLLFHSLQWAAGALAAML